MQWANEENIDKSVIITKWVADPVGNKLDLNLFSEVISHNKSKSLGINLEALTKSEDNKLQKLLKEIGLIDVKRGGDDKSLTGTWIHRDLAIKYTEWLDPKFSIWISKKILELVNDGVAWNEIRNKTKKDYLPLTSAIKKYVVPANTKTKADIIYG